MIDLKGPNGKIEFRLTHKCWSEYEDENENITEMLETHYTGDDWQEVAQQAADDWDWDDEAVYNFDAKSDLFACERDFIKMEYLDIKDNWVNVPEEVENFYQEALNKAMDEN